MIQYLLTSMDTLVDLVDELDGGTQEELGCELMQTWHMKVLGWDM